MTIRHDDPGEARPTLAVRTLIFARAPVPGQVKTRLIPALGAAGAAALHLRLMTDLIDRLSTAALTPVELWVTPNLSHPRFADLAHRYALSLHQQHAGDLGQRLASGARAALTRADAVVLIGTDCPGLSAEYLGQAIEQLRRRDAVLGPALDGGYVLLGLRRLSHRLFEGIPWGGAEVAELTRQRLRELNWSWSELSPLADIDRPEDLAHLPPGLHPACATPPN
ncbi:flagellar biosynthesis protein FlgB [Thiocystis violacea]|nr:flagellar biosynthesis protein FlgB [Thiocystis violacea]